MYPVFIEDLELLAFLAISNYNIQSKMLILKSQRA